MITTIISFFIGGLLGFFISNRLYKRFLIKKLRDKKGPNRRGFYVATIYSNKGLAEVEQVEILADRTKIKILSVQGLSNMDCEEFKRRFDNKWIITNDILFGTKQDMIKEKLECLIKK